MSELRPPAFFEDGDGSSLESSKWTVAFGNRIDEQDKGIIIKRIGESPMWIRETVDMARIYAGYAVGYEFYDGISGKKLEQVPGGQVVQIGTSGQSALPAQHLQIAAVEEQHEAAGTPIGYDETLEGESDDTESDSSAASNTTF